MSNKSLTSYFKNVILMSGTPDAKQKELTYAHANNVCSCSPRIAMANEWICKPSLNLVNCADNDWPSAVKDVYEREVELYNNSNKLFMPVILVNCKSIDDVVKLRETEWFKFKTGKDFDFISIHSDKAINDNDGNINNVTAEINGVCKTSHEAYEAIEAIDNNEITKPIIVAQVQMIGEGINVKSFTSVITSSNSDKTAMQQIGRVLRNKFITKTVLEKKMVQKSGWLNKLFKKTEVVETCIPYTFSKVKDGHANVYVIQDNLDTISDLIVNLNNYELTDDCFSWGRKIDIPSGSSPEIIDESESSKLETNRWLEIDSTDPEIIEIVNHSRERCLGNVFLNFKMGGDTNGDGVADKDEFENLTKKKIEEGFVEAWTKRKNGIESDELFNVMYEKLIAALKNPITKMIWRKSKTAAMNMVFQDPEMTNFFKTHLTAEAMYQLSK